MQIQPIMKRTLILFLALTQAPLAAAQLELAGVRRARQQITPYRAATVDVIADLTTQLPAATRRGDMLDIRYLRAVAAADLVLLDYLGHGPVEREAIAEAMGEHPEDLLEIVHQELADVAAGPYLAECTDAMRAIETIEGGDPAWPATSPRRDIFQILEWSERARAADPVSALSRVGEDPCARGTCREPYRAFDEPGRRAIQAVQQAVQTLEQIRARAENDQNPLAHALGDVVDGIRDRFASIVLRPRPAWNDVIGSPTVVANARGTASVQHILHVDPDAVHWIEAPYVQFEDGQPSIVGGREQVAMPSDRRAFITAIPEIVEFMREREVSGTIALSANPRIEALVLWQVLASAERAEMALDTLAVVDEDGALHTRRFRTQESFDHRNTEVFVRLGGYSVRMGARRVTVPRQMVDGDWEHDRQALRSTVGRAQTVAFKTMGVAPADLLLGAVFTPDAQIATLVRR